jgi:hypothetical protein
MRSTGPEYAKGATKLSSKKGTMAMAHTGGHRRLTKGYIVALICAIHREKE